jgi:hypothetical protein
MRAGLSQNRKRTVMRAQIAAEAVELRGQPDRKRPDLQRQARPGQRLTKVCGWNLTESHDT